MKNRIRWSIAKPSKGVAKYKDNQELNQWFEECPNLKNDLNGTKIVLSGIQLALDEVRTPPPCSPKMIAKIDVIQAVCKAMEQNLKT